jgi:hypothetical protein
MHELLAARFQHAVYLFCAKNTLVKIERGGSVMHNQFRDELILSLHGFLH